MICRISTVPILAPGMDAMSYNPFFGCDVGFIGWLEKSALIIYHEKHETYLCRLAPGEAPVFAQIGHYWVINDWILGHWDWRATASVSRLSLPTLQQLAPLTEDEARAQSILPPKSW